MCRRCGSLRARMTSIFPKGERLRHDVFLSLQNTLLRNAAFCATAVRQKRENGRLIRTPFKGAKSSVILAPYPGCMRGRGWGWRGCIQAKYSSLDDEYPKPFCVRSVLHPELLPVHTV